MNKKLLLLTPLILLTTSCQISKVQLTYSFMHESDERDVVFSHEITTYESFMNKNMHKESYIMYIYDDKNCMCYLELKSISKDFVIENNVLVYTMDVDVIGNRSAYGYKVNGHSFPSICIFEEGKIKYQVDYNDVVYFENSSKYAEYITERVEFSTTFKN